MKELTSLLIRRLLVPDDQSLLSEKARDAQSIINALAKQGMIINRENINKLLEKVRSFAQAEKRNLTMEELKTLYWSLC